MNNFKIFLLLAIFLGSIWACIFLSDGNQNDCLYLCPNGLTKEDYFGNLDCFCPNEDGTMELVKVYKKG